MSATPKAPNLRRIESSLAKVDAAMKAHGGHEKSAPGPTVRLIRGDAVRLEPVAWLWPHYLPAGMLTILGGSPGCGKTTIALSVAAIITRGGGWPDSSRCTEAGDVLIWSGEDVQSVTAARLVASGADMTRVHMIDGITGEDGGAFDPGRNMVLLEAEAARLPSARLLILDPIVSAVAGDSHKGAEVRRSLQPVVDLAQRLGCAVLGITHFSKGTAGRDPVERVTGSIAFAALARMVWVAAKVKPEPGDEGEPRRVLMRAKSNIGPDNGGFAYGLERAEVAPGTEGQRVRWLGPLKGSARELLAEADAESEHEGGQVTNSDIDDALRRVLGRDTVPSQSALEAMRAEGFTPKQVRTARERVGVVVKRSGFGKEMKTYWSLPHSAELPDDATPFVPTADHPCPFAPTIFKGINGHKRQDEGTNGAGAAALPGHPDHGAEVF